MSRLVEQRLGLPREKLIRLLQFLLLAATLLAVDLLAMTLAESLFLSNAGADRLPFFYVLLAVISLPVATFYSQLVDRFPRFRLFRWLLGAAILVVVGLHVLVSRWDGLPAYFLVYMAFSLLEALVDIQFWVLVSDYFTSLELKRYATFLVMAMSFGGLVGGSLASALSEWFSVAELLLFVPALYLLAVAQVSWLERSQKPLEQADPEDVPEAGLRESLRDFPLILRRHPVILLIAASASLSVVLRCLAEFQAFHVYEASFPDEQDLTSFLGRVGAALSVLEFAVLFFVTRPLIRRLGVHRMSVIHPATTLASFAGLAASLRLPSALAANLNYETLGNSIAQPVDSLNYNAVPRRFLGRVRTLTDGLLYPGGTALAGLFLLVAQKFLSEAQIAVVGLGLSVLFVAVGYRTGGHYLRSLVEMLRARSVNLDDVGEGLARLPEKYAAEVRQLLRSDERSAQILGIELAARMNPAQFLEDLQALLPRADVAVRRALVKLYVAFRPKDLARQIRESLESDQEALRELALEALLASREPLDEATLRRLLCDSSPVIRGLACVGVELSTAPSQELREACRAALDSGLDARAHLAMIQAARAAKEARLVPLLRRIAEQGDSSIKDDALEALAAFVRQGEVSQEIEELATGYLDHPEAPVRAAAVKLCGLVQSPSAMARTAAALEDAHPVVRDNAAAALAAWGERGLPLVEPYLRSFRSEVVDAAIAAIGGMRSRRAEDLLYSFMQPAYRQARRNLAWLRGLPPASVWMPLRTALEDSNQRVVRRMLHVLSALGHSRTLNCVRRILASSDERARADAVETLASLSHRRFVEPVLGLLEFLAEPGRQPLPGVEGDGAAILAEAARSGDRWVRIAALGVYTMRAEPIPPSALRENGDPLVRTALLHTLLSKTYHQGQPAAASHAPLPELTWERSLFMNRVLFLKSIALFRFLTLDDLLVIDEALVQNEYLAGETIFADGSLASDLCIVCQGRVAIRKKFNGGERVLAQLGAGECFGEMALFDDAPRSATAVALTDCTLLTLERGRFFTLIAQRPEIAVEMCKVLSLRLREANERLGRAVQDAALASPPASRG